MKKFILFLLIASVEVAFCSGEGSRYIGEYLGEHSQARRSDKSLQQQRQLRLMRENERENESVLMDESPWDQREQETKNIERQPGIRQGKFVENLDEQSSHALSSDEQFAIKMLTTEELSKLSALPDQISPEIISKVVVGDRLEILLNRPDLLNKLSKAQIQAIRPEELLSRLDENNLKEIVQKFPGLLDKFSKAQIQVIDPEFFSRLSSESLKILLDKPKVLENLTQNQIQAINPESLSEALYDKLSQPLSVDFVNKLSWQQVRQLLGYL